MKQSAFFFFALPVFLSAGLSYADEKGIEDRLNHAARVIKQTYGDDVSFKSKNKILLKFGRNNSVGTSAATVMFLPTGVLNETYVTTNLIDKFSSSSTADATETLTVEGHTCTGGIPTTFVTQNITMAGQTETALTTPLCRVTRAFNTSSTELQGNVYFYEDDTVSAGVPQTNSKVHMIIAAGRQQSNKAATAFSSIDYGVCTQIYGSVVKKGSAYSDFELQVRLPGGVFREQFQMAADSTGGAFSHFEFNPALIIPPSSDVRLVATADSASTSVSGGFNCYLAKIQ